MYDRDRTPVVSLAVLGDEDRTWRPDGFGYALWGCELMLCFPTVKLRDLDPAMLATILNPFAVLTLLHRDAQETRGQPEERLRRKVARYRALLRQGYTAVDIRSLLRIMEHLLRLDPELARQAQRVMRQVEVEELGMETFVTSFQEIGREEGRIEGQLAIVMRQLNRKLGPMPTDLQALVAALRPDRLLDLSDALLDFASQADLIAWLDQHARASDA